jgi:hypothetical protein
MLSLHFVLFRLFRVHGLEIGCVFFCFESFIMATRSVLERYYHRLPAGHGSGSSTSAGARSSIASSANDGDG